MACIAAMMVGIVDIVLAQNNYKECRPLDLDGPKIHNCELDPNKTPAEGEEPCTIGNISGWLNLHGIALVISGVLGLLAFGPLSIALRDVNCHWICCPCQVWTLTKLFFNF